MTSDRRQRISVRFLRYKKNYLLLAIGKRKIENREPNMAPNVRQPINRPLAIGLSKSGP